MSVVVSVMVISGLSSCRCVLMPLLFRLLTLFFFNDTATTEIYTLSLHDALPISFPTICSSSIRMPLASMWGRKSIGSRSEEHTSELQSPCNLVCRLLLEKKNNTTKTGVNPTPLPSHDRTWYFYPDAFLGTFNPHT